VRAPVVWALCATLMLSACSKPRPVLYDNAQLKTVGKEVADQDIEACKEAAEAAGAEEGSGKAGGVAKNTAVGAGVGAASGAVGGAISGSPGLGAAIGAASGAVWGLLMGLFNARSSQPRLSSVSSAVPESPSRSYGRMRKCSFRGVKHRSWMLLCVSKRRKQPA